MNYLTVNLLNSRQIAFFINLIFQMDLEIKKNPIFCYKVNFLKQNLYFLKIISIHNNQSNFNQYIIHKLDNQKNGQDSTILWNYLFLLQNE